MYNWHSNLIYYRYGQGQETQEKEQEEASP